MTLKFMELRDVEQRLRKLEETIKGKTRLTKAVE
jgi:hypothetical protein